MKYGKRDEAEADVVKALRQAGASVIRLETPVDLLIGYRGWTHIAEVKTPGTQYGKDLNGNQSAFAKVWRGSTIHVLRTVVDVEAFMHSVGLKQ